MKLRDIIGLSIALLLAIGVAFLTRVFLTEEKQPKPGEPTEQQVQLTKILVAGNPLSEGVVIKAGDLTWQNWPVAALNPAYIKEGTVAIESLLGAIVRYPLDQGEPVNVADLVKPGDKGILAAMVAPGKRALSIEVKPSTVSSGLILPGDYVDVVFSKTTSGAAGVGAESRTIVKNVKVLAMDVEMASMKSAPGAPPKVATLEVTPTEAELIEASAREGTLSLSLQGLDKTKGAPVAEEASSKEGKVTVIRGKDKSEVQIQEY